MDQKGHSTQRKQQRLPSLALCSRPARQRRQPPSGAPVPLQRMHADIYVSSYTVLHTAMYVPSYVKGDNRQAARRSYYNAFVLIYIHASAIYVSAYTSTTHACCYINTAMYTCMICAIYVSAYTCIYSSMHSF